MLGNNAMMVRRSRDANLYEAVWDIFLPQSISTYAFFARSSAGENLVIDWGDGSSPEAVYPYLGSGYAVLVSHSYPGSGSYRIRLNTSPTNTKAFIYLGEPYSWKQGTAGDNVLRPVSILKIEKRLMGKDNGNAASYGRFAYGCTNLEAVNLGDTVTSIGSDAFYGCTSLATASLPSGVTSIGSNAFRGCTSLEHISLPSGVTSIGSSAFQSCTSLAVSELPNGVTSIGNYAFYGCSSLAVSELPNGVTSIGNYAFYGCSSLAVSALPEGIASIGTFTFADCKNIAISSLPEGVTSIGSYAFRACRGLTISSIPSLVDSIGSNAFRACWDSTQHTITFLGTPSTIDSSAFSNCTKLTDIYVPWSEGEVAGAPWGATNATIHYNSTHAG